MDPSRVFVTEVKRLIIKVGTAVVTRPDGRLAMGRLGALCEQVKELNSRGFEVIIVTSGAVGVGRQRLRYRRLVNTSFADLEKPQLELDGKACAAVGQSGLMALYDCLFSQLDVTSSQLIVTDSDFKDPDFRMQLCQTVNTLLDLTVIPVFNENDAISTRRASYEGKKNPRAADPSVDHARNSHFLVLLSENVKEACAALSRPLMTNQGISNQGIVKLDVASSGPISVPATSSNSAGSRTRIFSVC